MNLDTFYLKLIFVKTAYLQYSICYQALPRLFYIYFFINVKKMFKQGERKIECAVGNREICVWQSKKAEIVLILFLTSGFAAFICLWLLVLPNSNNLINHVLSPRYSASIHLGVEKAQSFKAHVFYARRLGSKFESPWKKQNISKYIFLCTRTLFEATKKKILSS